MTNTSVSYDANGNHTTPSPAVKVDVHNRIYEFDDEWTYRYDPFGRRVVKEKDGEDNIGERHFYYDGVNFDPTAVRLAVDFAGADHVMAASDYPHQIGSIAKMKSSLADLRVSEEERKKIMGENARKLYRL